MNINIAFNTIIYIMVFLFPGILFRRAFFSGDFNKHFESGNTFERLLWNMLASILMLVAFCTSIYCYNQLSSFDIIFDLQMEDIADTFICIYENKLPTIFISEERIIQTLSLLFSIYLFSACIGIFLNRIIFYFGLEKRYSIFQFQNSWQYITNSNRLNNSNHSAGDIFYTKIDVKTKADELFTGKLHLISYDKEGKIEAITIQDAYKFYRLKKAEETEKIQEIRESLKEDDPHLLIHSETSNTFVYRKRIKGDLFTIFNNDLENISITYIKISNVFRKFQKVLRIAVSTLLLVVTIFSLMYAIWDFHIISFSNYSRRLVFCITTPIFLMFLFALFIAIFDKKIYNENKKKYYGHLKDTFLIILLFGLPFVYVFTATAGWIVTLISFVYTILMGFLLSSKGNK